MLKTTCDIKCLSPETQNEILGLVPEGTLVLVLDGDGNITPLAIGDGETQFIDKSTAEEKVLNSTYTSLCKCLTFSFGSGSKWCLVHDGAGNLVWNYHP